ncbi:hypothetical protein OK016_01095 [Vibrio chagasii]|nr:hypothetical protein [Vibrio chagasii]
MLVSIATNKVSSPEPPSRRSLPDLNSVRLRYRATFAKSCTSSVCEDRSRAPFWVRDNIEVEINVLRYRDIVIVRFPDTASTFNVVTRKVNGGLPTGWLLDESETINRISRRYPSVT